MLSSITMIRHSWDISPRQAVELQRKLSHLVLDVPLEGRIDIIMGVDCAEVDGGKSIAAAAALCSAKTLELIAVSDCTMPSRYPYIPGLLSFREAPAVIEAINKLPIRADLLICDGQGVAHPRGVGLASHVGLWLGIPTMGVAKSRLCGRHRQPGSSRNCRTGLYMDGRVVGAVVRTRSNVHPVYVSIGHRITLQQAVAWALRCAVCFRIPEPIRLAHHAVGRLKRNATSDLQPQDNVL